MSCARGGMESTKEIYSLAGIVVWVVEDEIGEDDLDALAAVTAEFVVAIHRGGVRRRVAGRSERAVLLQVAAEQTVARRTCNQKQRAPLLFSWLQASEREIARSDVRLVDPAAAAGGHYGNN